MMSLRKLAATAVLAFGVTAAPMAFAQQAGLVTVNVEDLDLLNDLQLAAPISIQVPVGIAATVCGVQVAALTLLIAQGQDVECEAENTTRAFSRLVAKNEQ